MTLRETLTDRFGGLLLGGKHSPDSRACVLELAHAHMGQAWSDKPDHWPDLRPLNDGPWGSDEARTAALLPVLEALWDWRAWPVARQVAWAKEVALRTITEVLPAALHAVGLTVEAENCAGATDLRVAIRAANAAIRATNAAREAAKDAAYAAGNAAYAARDATNAAIRATNAAIRAANAANAANAAIHAAIAAKDAAYAAKDTANAAIRTANAARDAAGNNVLLLACRIWVEAAATPR